MPEITADKVIGKTLFARKKIDKLNYSLQKIGEFNTGDSVGKVYSYIQRGGSVYWLFDNGFGNRYAVKHDSTAFKKRKRKKKKGQYHIILKNMVYGY